MFGRVVGVVGLLVFVFLAGVNVGQGDWHGLAWVGAWAVMSLPAMAASFGLLVPPEDG